MPRPSLISKIHELSYELRRSRLKPSEAPEISAQREAVLDKACEEYRCSRAELLRAIAPDFGK
jgi:hypothetical protein